MPRTQTTVRGVATKARDAVRGIAESMQRPAEAPNKEALRATAIDAIVRECNTKWAKRRSGLTTCTPELAAQALDDIAGLARKCRENGYTEVFVDEAWMRTARYKVMDAIMRHGSHAKPGSAAEAVQNAVLEPGLDEFAFVHDQRDAFPHYCTVRVYVGVIRSN